MPPPYASCGNPEGSVGRHWVGGVSLVTDRHKVALEHLNNKTSRDYLS